MGSIEEYIIRIKIPTSEVKLENIQVEINRKQTFVKEIAAEKYARHLMGLLKKIKAVKNDQIHTEEFKKQCEEILEILWLHLYVGFEELDDQLLCSTCFYTILTYYDDNEHYFKNILDIVTQEIENKVKGTDYEKNISTTISLMYGIFQSSILLQTSINSTITEILKNVFTLLTLMAYDYSRYTFIVFKIMTFFKKVIGTKHQEILFNDDCNFKLLNVINHNWENPITGVRSLNQIIYQHLITVLDKEMHEIMLKKLNCFYWNKAKYLMFSEIIQQCQSDIVMLISKYKLVEGLEYSLYKAGLVSAGADLYIAIVKKVNTDEEWLKIFSSTIFKILQDDSIRPIENFINYWSLNTFKSFPTLIKIIFELIEKQTCLKQELFACLSLMQQTNRLGLLEKNFDCCLVEKVVLNGIEHSDVKIRALSFGVICGSQRKFLNDQNEYNLILEFLNNNVNSDCSLLRISMIEDLQKFLSQKHMEFLNNLQNKKDYNIETDFLTFCTGLQLFIIESLSYDGNYQRKIATVQIIKVMLKSFTDFPRKKQKEIRQLKLTLLSFLKTKQHWLLGEKHFIMKLITLLKDPSDDIRANVMDILLHNYPDDIHKYDLLEYLTSEAVTSVKSRFFYQISCGHTIFKLIVNLLLLENATQSQFKKVEDVFEFSYKIIKSVCDSKIGIIESIDEGKQVHSYLSILYIIFEVCLGKSYKLNISADVITSLLEILESVSNQFAWEQESSVSSDFSKMNDMVETIISNSEHKINNEDNKANVSGLHQIVVNCLWLNVKASCQLSTILIKYYSDDTYIYVGKRCLNIICHVLETSRHKGAIEAGGTALGQAIQQLTSLSEGSMSSKTPMKLLNNKLNELISETNNMASVTRRGAGLSIMIHRIVSSDMKKGKPLFHFFMQVLMRTLKMAGNSFEDNENINNEKDLPKAIYIHFLTKITIDSSLASDMLFYSAKLAEIAFSNLTDSHWQIRNAALQLYGSLIPKLIGQKKKSGANEEVIATVAIDEFHTHSPKLWNYIVEQLQDTNKLGLTGDEVQNHNNLVPILSVIANMAPMYSFSDRKEHDDELLPSLISLLGSPIYVVRRLTARCLINIYTFEVILDVLLNSTCETENCLHGTLILLNVFVKEYKNNDLQDRIKILKKKYYTIMISKNHSYLCREKFEQTFPDFINQIENVIRETLVEVNTVHSQKSQGIFVWSHFRMQKYIIENAQWEKLPQIVTLLIESADFEANCETLSQRIQNNESFPEEILLELSTAFYLKALEKKRTIIWKILYEISLKTGFLSKHLDTSLLHNYLLDKELTYGMRYIIPLAARVFNSEEVLTISKIIYKLSSPEISDVDMRLIAATACNELARKFSTLSEETKINTTKAVVMFLQDEDEDIRNLSVHFYRLINMEKSARHPYICLRKILSYDFLISVVVSGPFGIQSLCNDLMNFIGSLTINHDDEYNPFASDSKNIYLEPEVIKQLLCKLKTDK